MIGDLLHILMMHQGRDRAISADHLLATIRTYGQDVSGLPDLRALIHDARQVGHLIASCEDGYFLPVTTNEAAEYIKNKLVIPASDLLRTARIQRRRMRELLGSQLRMI